MHPILSQFVCLNFRSLKIKCVFTCTVLQYFRAVFSKPAARSEMNKLRGGEEVLS